MNRENSDTLDEVVAKLYAIRDFFQLVNNSGCILSKQTPYGVSLVMGECIDILKTIGGIYDQSAE
jgi:hypothetical protein